MKKRIYLQKYKHSTLNNLRILCIDVYPEDRRIEVKTLKEQMPYNFYEPIESYSADYLICMIQYHKGINVIK